MTNRVAAAPVESSGGSAAADGSDTGQQPIGAYQLSSLQQAQLQYFQAFEIHQCMSQFGFNFFPAGGTPAQYYRALHGGSSGDRISRVGSHRSVGRAEIRLCDARMDGQRARRCATPGHAPGTRDACAYRRQADEGEHADARV